MRLKLHVADASSSSAAVVMRFMPVGNTPVLKQNVFRIAAASLFQAVIRSLKKKLGMKDGDPLFTYINSTFAPAPDEVLGNLYKSFGTQVGGRRELIVHYRWDTDVLFEDLQILPILAQHQRGDKLCSDAVNYTNLLRGAPLDSARCRSN
ncbi:Ubiquitin-like protein ATG12 [Mycena venus]|uniref:Ubiquitin-like protein ATG12 n=1 Tax=Mycena venus TaxID=2733690 RepID=A0A8H7D6A2_9AGAR|nr:Ubiquitin-like protein ATG12 [Mycena venus]